MTPFKITPEQENVINATSGNLQIIACAGSGKTEVVSRRIAKLIKNGAIAKSIVAFTFTEKAAEELKSRIRTILDAECPDKADLGDMYVGTIHGFCFEMLKELKPIYRSYEVLDDPKKFAFLSMPDRYYNSHIEVLRNRDRKGKFDTLAKFFRSYDLVRMENDVTLSKLTDTDFAECCRRYEEFLKEDRYIDFTGMIYRLVRLLEKDSEARKTLHKRIKHLIVDEYQDVDQLQERLIHLISEKSDSLCVVGDDDQCIYNWRGSTVENIIDFSKNYPEVERKDISYNFRSTTSIIECAQNFIRYNSRRLKKTMQPLKQPNNPSEKGDLFYFHFKNEIEEFQFIVDRIKSLLGTDFMNKNNQPFSLSYGDFAILTRTRKEAAKIVAFLDHAGIDSVLEIGGEVFERPEVQLALSCIAYVFSQPLDGRTVIQQELVDRYTNVFVNRVSEGVKKYPQANVKDFMTAIEKVRQEVLSIQQKGKLDYLQSGLQPFYHDILSSFGAEKFQFEDIYNYGLAILSQAISDYESVWRRLRAKEIKYFIGFLQAYGSSAYSDTSHNDPSLIDVVKVLTIHRAKGLEFPVVFVPGFVKEAIRNQNDVFVDDNLYAIDRYEGDEEDERRVYYTAVTRSMKYLFVSGSAQRRKADGTDYIRQFKPHKFAGELLQSGAFSDKLQLIKKKSGFDKRAVSTHLFPTTFTDINCYKRCGYDYLLRNLFGYEIVIPPAYGYGLNLHNILNIIYNEYMQSKKIPEAADIDNIFAKHFYLRHATEKITEALMKGGGKVIKNYVTLNQKDFDQVLETEKRFELVQSETLISGQIDLLKKFGANGDLKEVEIIDFKTESTQNQEDQLYQQDHELQLRLYAIACFKSLGLKPKIARIHFLDGNVFRDVPVEQIDLEKAAKEIDGIISNIVKKDFKHQSQGKCDKCDYKKICSRKDLLMQNV